MSSALRTALGYMAEDAAAQPVPDSEGQFVKGMRSGTYGMGSQLNSAMGAVADAFGANNIADARYAEAQRLHDLAGQNGPRISSLEQLGNEGYSLRNMADYATGVLGQSVPSLLPGLIPGMAASTPLRGLMGATAAYAPMEMGDAVQRLQEMNGTPRMDASQTLQAAGTGLGSAALQSVVPALAGGKLAGKVGNPVGLTMKQAVGRNLGAIPMEGATEAGGELAKQLGTGQDYNQQALIESGVAGMIGGTPSAALGAGGDYVHGRLNQAGNTVKQAQEGVKSAIPEGPKDLWGSAMDLAESAKKGLVESDLGQNISERASKFSERASRFMADPDVTAETKAKVEEMVKQGANATNATMMWAMDKAHAASKATSKTVETLQQKIDRFRTPTDDTGAKIMRGEPLADPDVMANGSDEQVKAGLAGSAQKAAEWASKKATDLMGKVDPETRDALQRFAGKFDTAEAQKYVAEVAQSFEDRTQFKRKVSDFGRAVNKAFGEFKDGYEAGKAQANREAGGVTDAEFAKAKPINQRQGIGMTKKSADESGVINKMREVLKPHMQDILASIGNDQDALHDVGKFLHNYVNALTDTRKVRHDPIDLALARWSLTDMLGDKSVGILADIAEKFGLNAERESADRLLNELAETEKVSGYQSNLKGLLEESLSPEALARDPSLKWKQSEVANMLMAWAHGKLDKSVSDGRKNFDAASINRFLADHYGAKARGILRAVERMTAQQKPDTELDTYDPNITTHESDAMVGTKLVGGGNKGQVTSVVDPAFARAKNPQYESDTERRIKGLQNEGYARAKFVSITEDPSIIDRISNEKRAMTNERKRLEAAFPGDKHADHREAEFQKFRQGRIDALAAEGRGMIEVTEGRNNGQMTEDEDSNMRMDARGADNKNHPSRVEIKKDNGQVRVYDAVKITREMMRKITANREWTKEDDKDHITRIARAFSDGMAMLMEKYGRKVVGEDGSEQIIRPAVKPDTVIWSAKGEPPITAGQALKHHVRSDKDVKIDRQNMRLVEIEKKLAALDKENADPKTSEERRKEIWDEKGPLLKQKASIEQSQEGRLANEGVDNTIEGWTDVLAQLHRRRNANGVTADEMRRIDEEIAFAEKRFETAADARTREEANQGDGRHGATNDGNISVAGASMGENDLAARTNMDGSLKARVGKNNRGMFDAENAKRMIITAARMESFGGIGERIANQIRTLAKNHDMMARADREAFFSLVNAASPSQVGQQLADLGKKYKGQFLAPGAKVPETFTKKGPIPKNPVRFDNRGRAIDGGTPSPKAQAAQAAALNKATSAGDAQGILNALVARFAPGMKITLVDEAPRGNGSLRVLKDGSFEVRLKPGMTPVHIASVVTHEFGHALQRHAFDNAPEAVRNAIMAAYNADLDAMKGATKADLMKKFGHLAHAMTAADQDESADVAAAKRDAKQGTYGYTLSFEEWFANQVSKYATSNDFAGMDAEVRTFWEKTIKVLKDVYRALAKEMRPAESFEKWMDQLAKKVELGVTEKQELVLKNAINGDKQLMDDIGASEDPKKVQRVVEFLNNFAGTGKVDEVIAKANERIAELIKDPNVAYGMQTRKYSLLGVNLHLSNGYEGFPATHDSPHRHEGKFDWRKFTGSGEGNAAFGAGTYLSTADGVHKSYKDVFTAQLNRDRQISREVQSLKEAVSEARDNYDAAKWAVEDGAKFSAVVGHRKFFDTRAEAEAALKAEVERVKKKLAEYEDMLRPENKGKYNESAVRRNIEYLQYESLPKVMRERVTDHEADVRDAKARLDEAKTRLNAAEEKERATMTKSPTYEVSVNIKPDQLLDWDKATFDWDKGVREKLFGPDATEEQLNDPDYEYEKTEIDDYIEVYLNNTPSARNRPITGSTVYRALAHHFGSQAAASDYLQSLGILGHRYAAVGGKNDQHPNYVIYDDSKITTNYVHFSQERVDPIDGLDGKAMPANAKEILDHIHKVLGDSVQVEFGKMMYAGDFTRGDMEDVIRISVHALNPMSVAHHESLHAFFAQLKDKGLPDVVNAVYKGLNSPHVMAQLRERLKHSPEALAQLADPEERAAYAYQFYMTDPTFRIKAETKTVFERIAAMVRKVLGIWSNDERALEIFDYFASGRYQQQSASRYAVHTALMKSGRNNTVEMGKKLLAPVIKLGDEIVGAGSERLRDSGIPALRELADTIKLRGTDEGRDAGYLPAARLARTEHINKLAMALNSYSQSHLAEALDALQRGDKASTVEARTIQMIVKKFLREDMLPYIRQSGVNIGDLGPDYFPRVWDANYINDHKDEFAAMAAKYGMNDSVMDRLIADINTIPDFEVEKPGFGSKNKRKLGFITGEDAEPFLQKDFWKTMDSYITQATRRSEWSRRFGSDNKGLDELMARAAEQGATDDQLHTAERYVKAVNGTLGDEIDPDFRQLQGNIIAYQNVRLLPMALFSSLVDPLGIIVRGGTVKDGWETFKRGIKELHKSWQGNPTFDSQTMLAEQIGTIEDAVLQHTISSAYGQGMMGDTAQKINDAFFRYNFMEGFNRSMRVGATQAALGFIARHTKGENEHSVRYLKELGLSPRQAKLDADGKVIIDDAVKQAVNRWVDGAVLRPDAADSAIWMNDPHFALIAHLKHFAFAFHHTFLKRVWHEYQHGNYQPLMALGAFVPMMMAADFVKDVVANGGDEPAWKREWTFMDHVGYGVERAGLLGVGQFALDGLGDIKNGGTGIGALGGPTIDQLGDAISMLGGRRTFESFALRSMPANALYRGYLEPGGASELEFDGDSMN